MKRKHAPGGKCFGVERVVRVVVVWRQHNGVLSHPVSKCRCMIREIINAEISPREERAHQGHSQKGDSHGCSESDEFRLGSGSWTLLHAGIRARVVEDCLSHPRDRPSGQDHGEEQ